MNEIAPVTAEPQGSDVLAGAWSVDQHLSPLALFDPNRTAICAQYQLALIDDSNNEARAHILAARRHLQGAVHANGLSAGRSSDPARTLRYLCSEMDKLVHGWD